MKSLLRELLIIENKKDDARRMIKPMIIQGTYSQEDIEKLMQRRLDMAPATADTYYHMIKKEVDGEGTETEDIPDEEPEEEFEDLGDENEGVEVAPVEFDDDGRIIGGEDNLADGEFAFNDNPNRRGVIRRIENAHLIYKRRNEYGTFDELWQYNTSDNMADSLKVRRDILSATDIPYRQTTSEDGLQKVEQYTVGDIEFLEIKGMPQ